MPDGRTPHLTEEFKRDAVRLAQERSNLAQSARDPGVQKTVLSRWKKRLETAPDRPFPGHGNPLAPEPARLKWMAVWYNRKRRHSALG